MSRTPLQAPAPAGDPVVDAHLVLDRHWQVLELTEAAADHLRCRPDQVAGKDLFAVPSLTLDEVVRAALRGAMVERRPLRVETFDDVRNRWTETRIYPEGEGLRVYFSDVSVRRRKEQLEIGLNAILAEVAAQQPLVRSLEQIALLYEQLNPGAVCSLLLLDAEGGRIIHGAAPSLPEAYNQAIHGLSIGEGQGSCGTAAWRRERVVVSDIAGDPLWTEFRFLAQANNLAACWSTPIFGSGNRVLGTFAVYYRTRREPDPGDLATIDQMQAIAAIAIDSDTLIRRARERDYFFQMSTEINCILDTRGERIVQSNRKFSEVSGYSASELRARHYLEFVHPEDQPIALAAVADLRASGGPVHDITFRLRCRDGSLRWVQWESVAGADGMAFAVGRDITERRQAQQALEFADTHDQLTHLPHRVVFEKMLAAELAQASSVWVLLVGMDRFHAINESMGHVIGDEVLKILAGRLTEVLDEEAKLARFTGDQFAVALVDGDERLVLNQAHRLREVVMRPIEIRGYRLLLTASIGISHAPDHGWSPRDLLRRAEAALGRVKHQGRDGICRYSARQMRATEERLELGHRLRGALDRNELTLRYQPLFDCARCLPNGFEALLRWYDPERGEISPARFVPIAEALGLMPEIGQWVVDQACMQARRWLDQGLSDFTVAVNISAQELQRRGLVRRVVDAMTRHRLPAELLTIELTESSLMENVDRARATLLELKAAGARLALDDFGTGYSSLAYLKHFPIDKLKIDQSFVRGLPQSRDDAAIARTIVAMAHQLRMRVAAEGVEHSAQAGFLREIGCDELQGHLIARPLNAAEARVWLSDPRSVVQPEIMD
ncbi:MAG: EAL domain-containing protein [Xanthomonadales bacterium]|nr:EAL domain-containing protein [Xanthomonadales bacterium]